MNHPDYLNRDHSSDLAKMVRFEKRESNSEFVGRTVGNVVTSSLGVISDADLDRIINLCLTERGQRIDGRIRDALSLAELQPYHD